MQFAIEIKYDHLDRALEAARREIATPHEMLSSIGESLFNANQERHDQGLAPDGSKWMELAPSTLANGPRKGGALKKTGRMLQSFNYQVKENVLRLGFDGARDGKLAAIHHGGSDPYTITATKAKALKFGGIFRKRVHHPGLPERKLIGFPESDERLVGEVIEDHLTAVLNRVR